MRFLKFITAKNLTFFDLAGIVVTAELARHQLAVLSIAFLLVWPTVSIRLEKYVASREVNDAV